jgi:hypothetical protein
MYAKLNNGQVEIYPYTIGQLRKDHHNVSFPKAMTDDVLAQFNVVRVTPVSPPTVSHTQVWNESTPVLKNGVWKQAYIISNVSAEDLATRTEGEEKSVRAKRNELLAQSDYTQLADAPGNATAWASYRDALRNLPTRSGFPWTMTWPTKPE